MFDLTPLPYSPDALEPWISAETVCLHHERHEGGYIKILNSLLRESAIQKALVDHHHDTFGLEALIHRLDPHGSEIETMGYRNACQAWSHRFYWHSMKPPGTASHRRSSLQSSGIDAFMSAAKFVANNAIGSPWIWLVIDLDHSLTAHVIDGVDTPMTYGLRPISVCDAWEHSYYLDYPADRSTYVHEFANHLVDWDFAASNAENAIELMRSK